MFEEVKKLPLCGLQIVPEKYIKRNYINYLGYELGLKKIQQQKVQIRKDQLQTLNNFQKLLRNINWICPTIRMTIQTQRNLLQTLQGGKDTIVQENCQLRLEENCF